MAIVDADGAHKVMNNVAKKPRNMPTKCCQYKINHVNASQMIKNSTSHANKETETKLINAWLITVATGDQYRIQSVSGSRDDTNTY